MEEQTLKLSNMQGCNKKMILELPATHDSPPASWPSRTKRHIAAQRFLFEHNHRHFIGRERALRLILVPSQPNASFHYWIRKEAYVRSLENILRTQEDSLRFCEQQAIRDGS